MAQLTSLFINVKVTVNEREGVPIWRVRWAYKLARLFGLPMGVEVEKPT